MSYKDIILANSPVFYHDFAVTAPVVASNGVVWNGASRVNVGPKNTNVSASFDGIDDFIQVNDLFDFFADPSWTFECWVKFGTDQMDYPTFMRRDNNGQTVLVRSRGAATGSRVGDIETYYAVRSDYHQSTYYDNQWHHVVLVRGEGSGYRLITDGVVAPYNNGSIVGGTMGTTAPTYIGKGSGGTEYFKGNIAHVAFYNTTLTDTDILNRYNAADDVLATAYKGWGIELP